MSEEFLKTLNDIGTMLVVIAGVAVATRILKWASDD